MLIVYICCYAAWEWQNQQRHKMVGKVAINQLYLALSPANHGQSISVLQSCLNSFHIWFGENGMALNPNKSVAILFGTPQKFKSLSGLKSVNVAGAVIPLSDKIKILSATFDANLTLAPHIKALSSSCFYHIRSFRQTFSSLDDSTALSVASALSLRAWTS